MRALGRDVGVPLANGTPALARRPVLLYVRGQSIESVMGQIGAFFATSPGRCVWQPAKLDGVSGYLFREEARSREARTRLTERLRKDRARSLQADLDLALRLANQDDTSLQAHREKYPGHAFWMPALKWNLRLLADLPELTKARLLSGEVVRWRCREMSPRQIAYIRQFFGGRTSARTSLPGRPGYYLEWKLDRDLPGSEVIFRLSGKPDRPGILMTVPTLPNRRIGHPDVLHPGIPRDGAPDWARKIHAQRDRALAEERARLRARYASDALLQKEITVRATVPGPDPFGAGRTVPLFAEWTDALKQVADQSGMSVLGDYDPIWQDYYCWSDAVLPGRPHQKRMKNTVSGPLWQVMEDLSRHFDVEWERKGPFLLVRSRRVIYAVMDGIDLLDTRKPPPIKYPNPDDPDQRERIVYDPSGE